MKTQLQSLTISLLIYSVLFVLLAGMAFGSEMDTNPPATSKSTVENITFEDESYIDDIPFNTKSIAAAYHMEEALSNNFNYDEEAYIDDIPFDTELIAANYKMEEAMNIEVEFEDEAYVDDIPASILQIALKQCNNLVFVK